MMARRVGRFTATGIEVTMRQLAHVLDDESLEIAYEDARRRRLTTTAAVGSYLQRFGRSGTPGVRGLRALTDVLDPVHASRSALEVKTRRLLVANGLGGFARELPLTWHGRTYYFDFGFAPRRLVLETNGRRWHDDANDYEYDNEKWSVPGRLGWRIVFATWDKVVHRPHALVGELRATLAA